MSAEPESLPTILENLGLGELDTRVAGELLLPLVIASILAAGLAYRPWRRFMGKPPVRSETAQMQIMIAVAGALMVIIIGGSMARAFGLVGLGGFIRFRSGIKDPRDAAIMFVMIGVGMACGIGQVPLAALATGFMAVILAVFDLRSTSRPTRMRVSFVLEDMPAALPALRELFPKARVLSMPAGGASPQKLVVEMDIAEGTDAARLLAQISERGVTGIREITMSED